MSPETQSVTIRAATLADAEGILRCLHSAFEPFRNSYSPQGFDDTVLTPATIGHRLKTMTVFVAISDGEVVGTIACNVIQGCEGDESHSPIDLHGHLRGMAVLPTWQGRGLAEQLLTTAESELRQRNCSRISLDTTAPLQRAIRFYERHGYRASGKVGDHFGLPLFEYVKILTR